MSIITRGFRGRRSRRRRAAASRAVPHRRLPGAVGGTDTAGSRWTRWTFTVRTELEQVHRWTWAELTALDDRDGHRRHPLRHRVDQAATPTGAGSPSTSCWPTSRPRPTSPSCAATAGTRPTCRWRTCSTARPGSPSSTTASDLTAEHGGPARLLVPHLYFWKSAKWVSGIDLMRPGRAGVLGAAGLPRLRRPVARAAVPGGLSWRAVPGARCPAGPATRDEQRRHPGARARRLAGAPGRSARRRAAHRARTATRRRAATRWPRLRTGTGSRSPCSDWATARCRRTSPTSSRSVTPSSCAARSVAGSSGAPQDTATGAAGRRRVRRRAADGDGPGPGGASAARRSGWSTRCGPPRTASTPPSCARRVAEDGGLDVAWVHTRIGAGR